MTPLAAVDSPSPPRPPITELSWQYADGFGTGRGPLPNLGLATTVTGYLVSVRPLSTGHVELVLNVDMAKPGDPRYCRSLAFYTRGEGMAWMQFLRAGLRVQVTMDARAVPELVALVSRDLDLDATRLPASDVRVFPWEDDNEGLEG